MTDTNELQQEMRSGMSDLTVRLGVTIAGYYWWRETKDSAWRIADIWNSKHGFVAHLHDGIGPGFVAYKGGEFIGPIPTPNVKLSAAAHDTE